MLYPNKCAAMNIWYGKQITMLEKDKLKKRLEESFEFTSRNVGTTIYT